MENNIITREIKFRGKRITNDEWVYGSLIVTTNPHKELDEPYGYFIHEGPNISVPVSVVPETIGQYTNIKDANGKAIYEDDVVNNQAATWVVKFNKGCFCGDRINAPELSYDTLIALRAIGPEKWVLGNTHDNPELLKP